MVAREGEPLAGRIDRLVVDVVVAGDDGVELARLDVDARRRAELAPEVRQAEQRAAIGAPLDALVERVLVGIAQQPGWAVAFEIDQPQLMVLRRERAHDHQPAATG